MSNPYNNATIFPDLIATRRINRRATQERTVSVYEDCHLPEDVLVVAWSRLLHSYVDEEIIVFGLARNRHVYAHSPPDLISNVLHTALPSSKAHTAVLVDEAPTAGQLQLCLQHDTDKGTGKLVYFFTNLPDRQLDQMRLQLQVILQQECQKHGLPNFNLVQEQPRLAMCNTSPSPVDGPDLLHKFLFHAASPEDLAIDYLDRAGQRIQLSYREVDEQSSLLAARIQRISGEDFSDKFIVPLLVPQCPQLYISLLGILKAGAAFCPLHLDTPADRIRFIFKDIDAKVVIILSAESSKLPADTGVQALVVDDIATENASESQGLRDVKSSDPCYVLYTSGSTGKPKGVLLTHRAVTQSLIAHHTHIPKFERWLQFAAPSFDVSMYEIFFPLFRGRPIVSCDRQRMLNDLPLAIRELNADAVELTPTVARTLIRKRSNVPTLQILALVGEMFIPQLVEEYGQSTVQSGILHALYGPTETTIHCTSLSAMTADSIHGNIGEPFSNTSLFIVSLSEKDQSSILPVGYIGELVIGGFQLAEGYLNRPEQTASAFFHHEKYGRLYRSGDKVRMLADGTLEILGRIAVGQVKLRGQRVELGEIEEVALEMPSIRAVTTIIANDRLVLFYTTDDPGLSEDDVLKHCSTKLLAFMVPQIAVRIPELPHLPSSGKLDRNKLEQYLADHISQQSSTEKSQEVNEETIRLCHILSSVLETQVDPFADLRTLCSDSLRAIQLASRLRRRGVNVGAAEIIKAQTPIDLAALQGHVADQLDSSSFQLSVLQEAIIEEVTQNLQDQDLTNAMDRIAPCSPLQIAMLAETSKDSQAYCNSIELVFPSRKSEEVLEAFHRLVRANDLLRSGFVATSSPAQPYVTVTWKNPDESQLAVTSVFTTSFAFSNQISFLHPLRVQILQEEHDARALIHIHHALYDGWSWDLVCLDIVRYLRGEDVPERPQFENVIKGLYKKLESKDRSKAERFWRKSLAYWQPSQLPNFNTSGPENPRRQLSCFRTSSSSLGQLLTRSKELEIHPQVFYQLSSLLLTGLYCGGEDVTIGTVSSGRTLAVSNVEEIIGPCITTLPLRLSFTSEDAVDTLLHKVQRKGRDLLQYGFLPLQDIRKVASIGPAHRLFDFLFIWQETLQTSAVPIESLKQVSSTDFLEQPCLLEATPLDGEVKLRLTFADDTISEVQAELLLKQIDLLVELMLHDPSRHIRQLSDGLPFSLLSIARELQCLEKSVNRSDFATINNVEEPAMRGTDDLHSRVLIMNLQGDYNQILPLGATGEICYLTEQYIPSFDVLAKDGQVKIIRDLNHRDKRRSGEVGRMLSNGAVIQLGRADAYMEKCSRTISTIATEEIDDDSSSEENDERISEWSYTERIIAENLTLTLDLHEMRISRDKSLFSYGIDSLSAIAFAQKLRSSLEISNIDVPTILQNPSIRQLAAISKTFRHVNPVSQSVELEQILPEHVRQTIKLKVPDSVKVLPCTPLQVAMLSESLDSSAYRNRTVLEFFGETRRMQHAWQVIMKKHEILRTIFLQTTTQLFPFVQVILSAATLPWRIEEQVIAKNNPQIADHDLEQALPTQHPPWEIVLQKNGSTGSSKLILYMHHALYDGIAFQELLQDVEAVYRGEMPSAPSDFKPFLEFTLQRDTSESDQFWTRLLCDYQPKSFPDLTGKSVKYRNSLKGSSKATRRFSLPLSAVEAACRDLQVSLLSICQAAFAHLLSVIIDEQDLCFGNVVSGRSVPIDGIERLVAPCFNTLPVRINLKGLATTKEVIHALHAINRDSLAYQCSSLRRIQSQCTSSARLFDALFLLQPPSKELDSSIWAVEDDQGEMNIPFVCEVMPQGRNDTLSFTLHCKRSLVLDEDIPTILALLDSTLQYCFQHPERPSTNFVQYPLELQAVSNIQPSSLNVDGCSLLHSAFDINASTHPDSTALEFLNDDHTVTVWTYSTLNDEAEKVSQALRSLGIIEEEAIPILMPKCPLFYASILGVLKAGAAFTPLDPGTPAERIQFMVAELGAQCILTLDSANLSWFKGSVFHVDQLPSASYTRQTSGEIADSNLAYRLYTSGSTGKPKAVSVEHRNAVQTIKASQDYIPGHVRKRILQYASTTFDMCYFDCFLAWSSAACLCASSQASMLNDLPTVINELRVSMLDLTPSVASMLNPESVTSVQYLYCIGEPMLQSLVDEWQSKCANSYGPTEAAMCTTIFNTSAETKSTVFGSPLMTTSFEVLQQSSLEPLPVFGVGELYIGGFQVAREYFKNENLSKENFLSKSGRRLYKTGDLVRKLTNGNFEFLGRTDDQVKIRGLRVELEEISSVLKRSMNFTSVSTQVLRTTENSKDQLVAFLVPSKPLDEVDEAGVVDDARNALSTQLPSYMVPTMYLVIDRLPLSAAGKVDKQGLNRIFQSADRTSQDRFHNNQVDLSSPAYASVISVLSHLSEAAKETISPETSIYQLGLDSISAVQIASELRKQGYLVNASDIMSHSTAGAMASYLATTPAAGYERIADDSDFDFAGFDQRHRPAALEICQVVPTAIAHVRPCTSMQSGMIAQFLHSQEDCFFNHWTFILDENTNAENVAEAWDILIEDHDMLRTGFIPVQGSQYSSFAMVTYRSRSVPKGMVHTARRLEYTVEEWRSKIRETVSNNLHRPPWRILILVPRDGPPQMQLSMHHALFDAVSISIILQDLVSLYFGQRLNPKPSIEPHLGYMLTYNMAEDEQTREFWRKSLEALSLSKFPDLAPLRSSKSSNLVASRSSSTSRADLERACRLNNITMQVAAQAAWAKLLAAYLGESSVTFGVVLSGRTTPESSKMVFPCLTTVPLTVDVNDTEILQNLMSRNTDIQRHQFTSLTRIQRWTDHPQDALFDTLFAYQLESKKSSRVHNLWRITEEQASVDVPISIELEPTSDDKLLYRLTFSSATLPREQGMLILDQLDAILSELLLLTNGESHQKDPKLYSIVPAKESTIPSDSRLVHHFVERSATLYPQKTALAFASHITDSIADEQRWTYSELDAMGNRVVNLLQQNNIQQRSIVAVCFEKCPEASFALLGILKAGCALMAIDPTAPAERKKFILEDSNASLLLTTESLKAGLPKDTWVPVLCVSLGLLDQTSSVTQPLSDEIDPDDTCYCLYTSGTTGVPKGCLVSHRNTVQALLFFQRIFRWHSDSRWLQFASFHFDVSILEQYWSWSVGICMVSAPRDLIFEDIAGAIRALKVDHIDLTPSLARLLEPSDVPTLCESTSVFITGGEALKQEIIDAWGPHETIYNGYGPTEATIGCTMYPRVPSTGRPSNIGLQFDNVATFVLEPNSETPVLRGAIGELCVSGALVAKGYLNRPKLTQAKFPTVAINGKTERIYRTGDLVRILHDGSFAFLGRADDQVKLRGQRLEIGEINSVLKAADSCIEEVSTQILVHPSQQREQLVAFIAAKDSARTANELQICPTHTHGKLLRIAKDAAQEKLAAYMVPTHFVPITFLPLTVNNKVDNRRLKDLFNALDGSFLQNNLGFDKTNGDPLLTEDERAVGDALVKYFNIASAEIQKSSNIFHLGVDSINVVGFAHSLRSTRFHNTPTSVVLQHPLIYQLAEKLAKLNSSLNTHGNHTVNARASIEKYRRRYASEASVRFGVAEHDVESIVPCTPLQEGIISRALESKRPIYHANFLFYLREHVDMSKLKHAWSCMFRNTQVLRTRLMSTDNGYVQAAIRLSQLPIVEHKTSESTKTNDILEKSFRNWIHEDGSDITRPVEVILVDNPQQCVMALHIFHALYDGISLPLLLDLVKQEYIQNKADYGPSFHEVLPYGPLSPIHGSRDFWSKILKPVSPSTFPRLLETPTSSTAAIAKLTIHDAEKFDACRRMLRTTHQALVQGCWSAILAQYLNTQTAIFGLVVSGRTIDFPGVEKVVGPMFNTLPFVFNVSPSSTWGEVVEACHEYNVSALPHQHTPLRDITKWAKSQNSRLSNVRQLFDTLFVFQRDSDSGTCSPKLWDEIDSATEADYPLALEVYHRRDGSLELTIIAQNHIADEKILMDILLYFKAALTELLNDPNRSVREFTKTLTAKPQVSRQSVPQSLGLSRAFKKENDQFVWSKEARQIQAEISRLSDSDQSLIGPYTSILELGLDSIDAVKLSSRLKRTAGISLPVSNIMQNLCVAGMIKTVASKNGVQASVEHERSLTYDMQALSNYLKAEKVNLEDLESSLPVTPLQEAMVAGMIDTNFQQYFNHDILRLPRDLDIERLKRAWQLVVDNSPILRTSFHQIDDPNLPATFAQTVHRPKALSWLEFDLNFGDFDPVIKGIRQGVADRGINEPPLQLSLVYTHAGAYLVLSLSHALYDGYSLALLHADVSDAYHERFEPRPSYHQALSSAIAAEADQKSIEFWAHTLNGCKPTTFPARSGPESLSQKLHRQERNSSIQVSDIQDFCKRNAVSVGALAQTVWSLVLANYTRKSDVCFGAVLSGRNDVDTIQVLFPLMNTVAMRCSISGSRIDTLKATQDNMTAMVAYENFPLRKARTLAANGDRHLFNTLFIYQKRPDDLRSHGESLYESIGGASDTGYPVCVEAEIVEQAFVWRVACKDSHLDEQGTSGLMAQLDSTLSGILDDPETRAQPEELISQIGESHDSNRQIAAYNMHNGNEPEQAINSSLGESSDVAKAIIGILAQVAQVPESEISMDSNIFSVGLDSISAIKVSSLLRKSDIKLSVSNMVRANNVSDMARSVQKASTSENTSPQQSGSEKRISLPGPKNSLEQALEKIHIGGLLANLGFSDSEFDAFMPATPGQIYMMSLWQDAGIFFGSFEYKLSSEVSATALKQAWKTLLEEHPPLRTMLIANSDIELPLIQCVFNPTHHENENCNSANEHHVRARSSFMLKSPSPLVSLEVGFYPDEEVWMLRLHIHHALYDAVSLALVMQRLQVLCSADRHAIQESQPKTSLAHFEQYVAQPWLAQARVNRKAFWTRYLDGVHQQPVVGNPIQKTQLSTNFRSELFEPSTLAQISGLESFARSHGISIHACFIAAYARAVVLNESARHQARIDSPKNGEYDFVVGVYLANRSHDLEDLPILPFPTLNIVPLRIQCSSNDIDVSGLLKVAKKVHYDLHHISTLENSQVTLHEIDIWTEGKVRIDTTINFLTLPELPTRQNGDKTTAELKAIGEPQDQPAFGRRTNVASDDSNKASRDVSSRLVAANPVRKRYAPTLDVEGSIYGSRLATGMFVPESMADIETLQTLTGFLKEALLLFTESREV